MAERLPAGTVTFLFTDVEASTRLLHELGDAEYARALAEHRVIVREAFRRRGGVEVDTQGDAFFAAFPTAPAAVAAAEDARSGLSSGPIRIRIGIHTGTPLLTDEGYIGADVHRAARIAACGHGGQILVSAASAALLPHDDDTLRDLGLHRLKDLSAPERIYQLGGDEFPPLKSLHRTNLPVPATSFLGRERELAEVVSLLSREDVRLLTLTGAGGSGKTRLGAQAAALVAERYPDGVWWISLAPLRDHALVLETAAQTLGARNGVSDHVGEKSMLLLFDNFEHVTAAAVDVAALLKACPNVEVLVTSREPLHVSGEQEYAVPPFAHEEGVGFFAARARAIDPRFEPDAAVSDICRRLDDLPLALELAAARVKALSTQQILDRLEQRLPLLTGGARDLPERQRTLRATIEWSYDLLTKEERTLFARVAVFRGGWTLEAAEDVVAADVDTLQALVDRSLMRRTGDRYWMLETLREYATERLEGASEVDELRQRHAEHFLGLARAAEPHLPAARREWIERLESEADNLRAAFDWFVDASSAEPALELAGALARFWLMRGLMKEGNRRLETALALGGRMSATRAKALTASAMLLSNLTLAKSTDAARLRAEEALAANEAVGSGSGIAAAEFVLAVIVASEEMARARDLLESSLGRLLAAGDEHVALLVRRSLAWVYENLGDRERCVALNEENLREARALGNTRIEAVTLGVLASLCIEDGRVDEAVGLLKESHRLHVAVGDPLQSAFDVFRFAAAAAAKGQAEAAATALSAADALAAAVDVDLSGWDPAYLKMVRGMIDARIDAPAFDAAWHKGRTLTADAAVALALGAIEG